MTLDQIWDGEYEEFVIKGGKWFVDIGASWCADCEAYEGLLKKVAAEATKKKLDINFVKVLIDSKLSLINKELKSMTKIKKQYGKYLKVLPYSFLIDNGRCVHSFPDIRSHGYVKKQIEEHLKINFNVK